jgi:hypothetical protein
MMKNSSTRNYDNTGLERFCALTKTRPVHSTLVSPTALRSLFVEGKQFRTLSLRGLGLTDSHVLAIVDGLSTPYTHVGYLNLESNPGITAQGYGALMNLINQTNIVGHVSFSDGEWRGFSVDDKAWEGKLNLVSQMNSEYRRLEYLTNGTFTSEERRWQWLERVVNLSLSDEDDEEDEDEEDDENTVYHEDDDDDDEYTVYNKEDDDVRSCDEDKSAKWDATDLNFIWSTLRQNPDDDEYTVYNKEDDDVRSCDEDKNAEWDAKHLNFIWSTLRQNPEMMQVSQAPTRTKKRNAT